VIARPRPGRPDGVFDSTIDAKMIARMHKMKPIQNGIQPRRPQISAATASPGVPCCDIGCIDIGGGICIGYAPYGGGGEYGASAFDGTFDGVGGGVGIPETIVGA